VNNNSKMTSCAVLIDLGAIDMEILDHGLVKVTLDGYVLGFHKSSQENQSEAMFEALDAIASTQISSLPGLTEPTPVAWFNPFTSSASLGPASQAMVFTALGQVSLPESFTVVTVSNTGLQIPGGMLLPPTDLHTAAAAAVSIFA